MNTNTLRDYLKNHIPNATMVATKVMADVADQLLSDAKPQEQPKKKATPSIKKMWCEPMSDNKRTLSGWRKEWDRCVAFCGAEQTMMSRALDDRDLIFGDLVEYTLDMEPSFENFFDIDPGCEKKPDVKVVEEDQPEDLIKDQPEDQPEDVVKDQPEDAVKKPKKLVDDDAEKLKMEEKKPKKAKKKLVDDEEEKPKKEKKPKKKVEAKPEVVENEAKPKKKTVEVPKVTMLEAKKKVETNRYEDEAFWMWVHQVAQAVFEGELDEDLLDDTYVAKLQEIIDDLLKQFKTHLAGCECITHLSEDHIRWFLFDFEEDTFNGFEQYCNLLDAIEKRNPQIIDENGNNTMPNPFSE